MIPLSIAKNGSSKVLQMDLNTEQHTKRQFCKELYWYTDPHGTWTINCWNSSVENRYVKRARVAEISVRNDVKYPHIERRPDCCDGGWWEHPYQNRVIDRLVECLDDIYEKYWTMKWSPNELGPMKYIFQPFEWKPGRERRLVAVGETMELQLKKDGTPRKRDGRNYYKKVPNKLKFPHSQFSDTPFVHDNAWMAE